MKGEHHERAKLLLDISVVEGVSEAEQGWLSTHLEGCLGCAAYAESLSRTVAAMRSLPAALDPEVVEATRLRVRVRAHQLREHQSRMRALWVACGLSWLLGVVSAPLLWWGVQWIGERLAVPEPARVAAFLFTWMAPATVIAALLVWRRAQTAGENGRSLARIRGPRR